MVVDNVISTLFMGSETDFPTLQIQTKTVSE